MGKKNAWEFADHLQEKKRKQLKKLRLWKDKNILSTEEMEVFGTFMPIFEQFREILSWYTEKGEEDRVDESLTES